MRDPYSILGVRRNANQHEIKAAWRAAAKALHPDQNPGDPLAASRFSEVGRAYEVLKDPVKRRLYDEALARASSNVRRAAGQGKTFMEQRAEKARAEAEARAAAARAAAAAAAAAASESSSEDAEEVISKIFGAKKATETRSEAPKQAAPETQPKEKEAPQATARPAEPAAAGATATAAAVEPEKPAEASPASAPAEPAKLSPALDLIGYVFKRLTRQAPPPEKAPDLNVDLSVTIEDILAAKSQVLTLSDGRQITVPMPDDAKDGTQVRIEGKGHRLPGARQGDVVVTLRIRPHSWYRHHGYDLITHVDIDIENAVLGCDTMVETLDGPLKVTIPPWSGSNYRTTIAGKGLPRGHGMRGNLIVEVRVLLWDRPDQKVIDLMRSLREGLYL